MAKTVDITSKLNFEEKPQIKIKDALITVNNEAAAMLKLLPKMSEKITPSAIIEICEMLFEQSEYEKIVSLKLNLDDFMVLVDEASKLVMGDNEPGEAATLTTTL